MLHIDSALKTICSNYAEEIVRHTMEPLLKCSTTSIERTTVRILLDEEEKSGVYPKANEFVDHLSSRGLLKYGAYSILTTIAEEKQLSIKAVVDGMLGGNLSCPTHFLRIPFDTTLLSKYKKDHPVCVGTGSPKAYVIVATGNIYEDVEQAKAAVECGADIIAVIRSTAQSLLDYIPVVATEGGFGGTYANYENFCIMRSALDKVEAVVGRKIILVNYASGLCMPEITYLAAKAGLGMLLNDAMYGILFRDINTNRTLIDQFFSRKLAAYFGITINTGEDNYLTTDDSMENYHTVTASQFLNYAFAKYAGMEDSRIGLGHAFEINPHEQDSFNHELVRALLTRTLFPDCPIKFMPPTKYKEGDIFFSHALDTAYNMASAMTGQSIHLVGMLTEALHTPHNQDRVNSLRSAMYAFNACHSFKDKFSLDSSWCRKEANLILGAAHKLLAEIKESSLQHAIERGTFANIKRSNKDGNGREGVFEKDALYFNPIWEV